jgi:tetratricopeptide (TPR) repeat protein
MQLSTANTQDDSQDKAKKLTIEALDLLQKGDATSRREAIKKFEAALAICRTNGDRTGEAVTLLAIGKSYDDLGEKQVVLGFYNQALSLWRAVGDREGEAITLNNMGLVYYSLGEKQKALGFFDQALSLSRTVGNRTGEATTLNNIGQVYDSLGDKQKALNFFNQALPLSRAIGHLKGEATTLSNIGLVYDSLGEKQQALDFYNKALSLSRAVGDHTGEAITLNNIGSVYNSLGQRLKALDLYNQALLLLRGAGNRESEVTTLNNIGSIYNSLGEKQKALDLHNQALSLSRTVGSRAGEAITLDSIGLIYSLSGEKQKALDFYNQALQLHRAVSNRGGEATALNGIGLVYNSLGEKQKALDLYNQALLLLRAIGDRAGEATTLSNIGLVYDSLGEKQKSLDFYNQSLSLSRAVGDPMGESKALGNIGLTYHSLGEKQKALGFYNQSLFLLRAVGDHAGEATVLNNIGAVYDSLDEKQKALDFYNKSLPLSRAVGDRTDEARTLNNIGWVYFSFGEKQKAFDFYNQAMPLWRAVGDRAGEALTLGNFAFAERSLARLDEARAHIEASLQIIESLRTKIERRDLRSSYFATQQDTYEFYIDLLMQMHQREPTKSHHAAALQASERSRARALLDSLVEARAEIRQGVEPALFAREKSAQQRLNAKAEEQLKLAASAASEAQIAAIKKEIEALTDELEQVRTQIRQTSPRYAALTQPQPLTAAEIQQALDADTLLLEYALGEERSFLWAVTSTTINSYELPRRAEIETAALRFYQSLSAPNQSVRGETAEQRDLLLKQTTGQFAEAAAQLSQMLLAPVAAQLSRKRLVIVADGALHHIPFGALPDPATNNHSTLGDLADRWKIILPTTRPFSNFKSAEDSSSRPFTPLIVNHEIINLPSASTLAVLRRELAGRKPAPKTLAVLADPVFMANDKRVKGQSKQLATKPDESLAGLARQRILEQLAREKDELYIARLPFTRQEAEQILALAPAGAGMKALDFEASRATAMSDQLSQYRYVHFATHGLTRQRAPGVVHHRALALRRAGQAAGRFPARARSLQPEPAGGTRHAERVRDGAGQADQGRGISEFDARLYVRGRGARGDQFVERERPGDGGIDDEVLPPRVGRGRAPGGGVARGADRDVARQTVGSAVLLGGFHAARGMEINDAKPGRDELSPR